MLHSFLSLNDFYAALFLSSNDFVLRSLLFSNDFVLRSFLFLIKAPADPVNIPADFAAGNIPLDPHGARGRPFMIL